jgi:Peptidase M50B-like
MCKDSFYRTGSYVPPTPLKTEIPLTPLTADEGVIIFVEHRQRPLITLCQGATRMSGGVPLITLPAGYLGSSFLGACMITCGFDTNASKVATLVLAAIFVLALFWARRQILLVCRHLDEQDLEGNHSYHSILSGLGFLFWGSWV